MSDITPSILFRVGGLEDEREAEVAARHFPVRRYRAECRGELVIPRYSALPYYRELEQDLKLLGSRPINSYAQHQYVADIRNWVPDLEGLTPKTYFRLEEVPADSGPLVVKGVTNSRKAQWKDMMFAIDKRAAVEVAIRLANDGLISQQELVARQFVPLDTLMVGLNGQPIAREFRFFVAYGQVLCGAFYWSSHVGDLEAQGIPVPRASEVPEPFLRKVVGIVAEKVPFVVVDVAKTASGDWLVVELNDGQHSGLSENDPEMLYSRLREVVTGHL